MKILTKKSASPNRLYWPRLHRIEYDRAPKGDFKVMTVCTTSLVSQVTDLRTLWFIKRGTVSYLSPFRTIRNLLFFIFAVNWPFLGQTVKDILEICLSLMHGTYAVFIILSSNNLCKRASCLTKLKRCSFRMLLLVTLLFSWLKLGCFV